MIPGISTLERKIRTAGGLVLRRLGFLPGGVPNRLGDDERWLDRRLEGEILVFFPDTRGGLYQLRSWYGPLAALHEAQGLTIVCMDSRTAADIRREVDLPVVTISQEAFFDELVGRSDVKVFLYVNYTQMNFLALRIRSAVHVSLLHGDSDKSVSVSNQAKAFDYSFVAGQAAVDRFLKYTALFDANERCVIIGRPQLDTDPRPMPRVRSEGESPVVLYAPTWEGGHDSVSYGSVPSHGLEMVKSLHKKGFRITYRPHPLTGQRLAEHGEADHQIRRFLGGSDEHKVSTKAPLADDFEAADLLIGDVSSVVNEWLVTGKPIIVTRSAVPETREAATKLLDLAPRLSAGSAALAGDVAEVQLKSDPTKDERLALAEYYLGDTSPGASIARFLAACRAAAETRDREWARIKANEST